MGALVSAVTSRSAALLLILLAVAGALDGALTGHVS